MQPFWKAKLPQLGALLFLLHGCYYIDQGRGQLSLQFDQVPIHQAIQNTTNLRVKSLLSQVASIKTFGGRSLGLSTSTNYQGYYATDQKGITFVVTAAYKTQLKPYTWWFPLIGTVPYKGYFNPGDAAQLKANLEAQDYDVYLFAAPAYSTLGWFKDPITTPMLNGGIWGLADSLLHEMAHATLYVNDHSDFNEQLASFVGEQGAILYLKTEAHWNQTQIKAHLAREQRYKQAQQLIYRSIPQFTKLYTDTKQTEPMKLSKRKTLFNKLNQQLKQLTGHSWQMNNARLLQYQRYQANNPLFANTLKQANNDWPTFWKTMAAYVQAQGW